MTGTSPPCRLPMKPSLTGEGPSFRAFSLTLPQTSFPKPVLTLRATAKGPHFSRCPHKSVLDRELTSLFYFQPTRHEHRPSRVPSKITRAPSEAGGVSSPSSRPKDGSAIFTHLSILAGQSSKAGVLSSYPLPLTATSQGITPFFLRCRLPLRFPPLPSTANSHGDYDPVEGAFLRRP